MTFDEYWTRAGIFTPLWKEAGVKQPNQGEKEGSGWDEFSLFDEVAEWCEMMR